MAFMQTACTGFCGTNALGGQDSGACLYVHGRLPKDGSWYPTSGKLGPLLLAEFKHKIMVRSSDVTVPKTITDDSVAPFQGLPLHSKLISSRTEVVKGETGDEEIQVSEFGVYYTPDEFLQMASGLQHPLDSPQLVDEVNLRSMLAIRDWFETLHQACCEPYGR